MDTYLLVKTLHIISATIVFGTGIGIAIFMFLGHLSPDLEARAFATRITVRADFLFTLPAVIVQPLSGAWLILHGGFAWNDYWLVLTYALYMLAGACWLPVVAIQMRMKAMLEALSMVRPGRIPRGSPRDSGLGYFRPRRVGKGAWYSRSHGARASRAFAHAVRLASVQQSRGQRGQRRKANSC
jgi:uncharacterized membrane protein